MRRLRHAPRAVAASLAAALLCFASAPCRAQIADDWEQERVSQDEWWDFEIPAERYPARSLRRAVKWFKDNW